MGTNDANISELEKGFAGSRRDSATSERSLSA